MIGAARRLCLWRIDGGTMRCKGARGLERIALAFEIGGEETTT
jgi:hypothetical protein